MDEQRKSCLFCKKTFSSKGNYQRHLTICKVKKLVDEQNITITNQEIKEILVRDEQISKLTSELLEKDKKIHHLNAELLSKDEQINLLKSIIENQKHTVINNNNNYKHTNTNTNNTINYISNLEPINFEEMKEQFENNLSNKYIDKGVEGIAMFICDIPCENKFITSDYSRKLLTYKNPQQQIIIDPKGNMLLNTAIKQNADTIIGKAENRYQYWKTQIDDAREEDIEPDKSDIEKKNKTKKLKTIAQKAKDNITFDSTDATNIIIAKGMENKIIVNTNDDIKNDNISQDLTEN
jgi:hypothetical protein